MGYTLRLPLWPMDPWCTSVSDFYLNPLLSEKMFYMVSVLLNLLRFVLWPRIYMVDLGKCSTSILVLLGYMFYMYVPVKFYWLIALLRYFTHLLIFSLVVPSAAKKGVLGPLTFNIISLVVTSKLLCSFVHWIFITECCTGIVNIL